MMQEGVIFTRPNAQMNSLRNLRFSLVQVHRYINLLTSTSSFKGCMCVVPIGRESYRDHQVRLLDDENLIQLEVNDFGG